MPKLNKKEFNAQHRFREAREGEVHCGHCSNASEDKKGGVFCRSGDRKRTIQVEGDSHDGRCLWSAFLPRSVCDSYSPHPSPPEAFARAYKRQALLLDTQHRDIYHADPECPYVIEELRLGRTLASSGEKQRAGVSIIDISDLVEGEPIRGICEMPCCSSKLPYQILMPDPYRQITGIKPDGTEEKIWVRKVVEHERKGCVVPSEAENIFDLRYFASDEFKGDTWERIHAAENYLWENSNALGSRPLNEAINPVRSSPHHHTLESPCQNPQRNLEFWIYDERLFDWRSWINSSRVPMRNVEMVPEGVIFCVDSKGIFRFKTLTGLYDGFSVYGNVKPVNAALGLPEGVSHFIEIGALSYNHLHNWTSGVFGKGFCGEARGEE